MNFHGAANDLQAELLGDAVGYLGAWAAEQFKVMAVSRF